MILSAIFHFLKLVFSSVIKVIAWLLVSLSLWVPFLYTLVFLIACGLTGSSLIALKNWYFAGLALSFIGSFAISSYFYEKRLKNKKSGRKSKSNIEKVKAVDAAPEIVKMDDQPAPQPVYQPEPSPMGEVEPVMGNSIIRQAMEESESNPLGKERKGNMEMRSKGDTAVKHGFYSYDNPQVQTAAQESAYGANQESAYGFSQGSQGFPQWSITNGNSAQSGYGVNNSNNYGFSSYSQPPVSGEEYRNEAQNNYDINNSAKNFGAYSASNNGAGNYSAANNYNANNYSTQENYSAGSNYNAQNSFSAGNNYNAQNSFSAGSNYNAQNSFSTGNNYNAQNKYEGYDSFNTFDAPVSGGFDSRIQGYEANTQGYGSRGSNAPVSGGGFEEQPRIFATKGDPTVFVYEYSDRLDYYKRTRSGMVFMHSRPKAANG